MRLSSKLVAPTGRQFVCQSCRNRLSLASRRTFSGISHRHINATSPQQDRNHAFGDTKTRNSPGFRTFSICTPFRGAERHGTRQLLPSKPARTRFAPSPTGYLHLGSLRTALFNYLLAKKTGGQFLLRIEDTDQKRLVQDAQQRLCDDLKWAGLSWDEGPQVGGKHEPYNQSSRTPIYQEYTSKLLSDKTAYRCFCRVSQDQPTQVDMSQIGVSAGGCQSDCESIPAEQSRQRSEHETFVVRFGKPSSHPIWTDLVYGKVAPDASKKGLPQRGSIADVVLLKTDGTPTYHLANVVDDHLMEITHVIRGTEWMPSTALHVALYQAFGWQPPEFAHVGLLTDEQQNKLSKRNFDTDIKALREQRGILAEALINFLALLGWRNPTRNDAMDLSELTKTFDLKFTRGNTIVTLDKLWFLQKHHAKRRIDEAAQQDLPSPQFNELVSFVLPEAHRLADPAVINRVTQNGSRNLEDYLKSIFLIDRGSYENPTQYIARNSYFLTEGQAPPASTDTPVSQADLNIFVTEFINHVDVRKALTFEPASQTAVSELWKAIEQRAKVINDVLNSLCHSRAAGMVEGEQVRKSKEYKDWVKAAHGELRRRLTYGSPSPSTGLVMIVLRYEECKRRISVE